MDTLGEQPTSVQPLDQRHLYLRLLPHRGGEADLRGVLSSYSAQFDMEKAPVARGYFVGDYEGLANDEDDFTPFFSKPHGTDPASVFFRRVGP